MGKVKSSVVVCVYLIVVNVLVSDIVSEKVASFSAISSSKKATLLRYGFV